VWSRSGGKKQTLEIAAIKDALHDQRLALADHHLINLRYEFSKARLDPDGDTFHGTVRYRAVTEHNGRGGLGKVPMLPSMIAGACSGHLCFVGPKCPV